MLNKNNFVIHATILLFLVASASANGLFINNSIISINKTVGVNQPVLIQVTNQEPYTFFNISIENNSYLSSSTLPSLASGQTAFINASVTTNTNVNTNLKVLGYFTAQLGALNKTYNVNVTAFESNPCDMTVIKGDTVSWKNMLNNQINMRNIADNQIITIMDVNQTYVKLFTDPTNLNYYFTISGFQFPQVCHITALSDSGLVNDPQLNGQISLSVITNYDPTTISSLVVVNNYTMDFSASQDGVMTVTNTGNKVAHSVSLSGDWFTFNTNNFDLSPGQSKGLIYTINPVILSPSDTNKSYVKTLSISGNFPTVTQSFNVNINYANFDANATGQDAQYLINVFCPKFPNSALCNPAPQVIYRYITNGSDQIVPYNYTSEQIRDLWLSQLQQAEDTKTTYNFVKETGDKADQHFATIQSQNEQLNATLSQQVADAKATTDGVLIFVTIVGGLLVVGIFGVLIYVYRNRNAEAQLRRFGE